MLAELLVDAKYAVVALATAVTVALAACNRVEAFNEGI